MNTKNMNTKNKTTTTMNTKNKTTTTMNTKNKTTTTMIYDIETKKKYIIDNSNNMDYPDRLKLLQIIKLHVYSIKDIKENADGSRINLDKLNDDIITKLYHIIISKLNINNNIL